jgi:hypothetical protein
MNKHIELPSGEVINIDKIVYMSNMELNVNTMTYAFYIIWSSNSTKSTFGFNEKIDCENTIKLIKNALFNNNDKMICD